MDMLFIGAMKYISLLRFFCSLDARFCVSTGEDMLFIGAMKYISLPRFLFGRRKILRLYWADAIIISCKTQ